MKATAIRVLTVMGVAAIAWAVGYVIADAPILTAQSQVTGGVPLSNDTISRASSETDHDIATFRSMLAGAFQEVRPLARRRRMIAAIATAPLDALPTGLQMILSLGDDEASEYTDPLFARWAELDPVQAAQKAAVSDDYPLSDALEAVMEVWVGAAPAAAEQWVRNLRGGETAIRSVEAFILAVAESDPQRALKLMRESVSLEVGSPMKQAGRSPHLYNNVFAAWGERDGRNAMREAMSLPAGAARADAIQGALGGWAKHDFRSAFRTASALPDPVSSKANVEWVLHSGWKVDAGQLAECVLELPAGPLRTAALCEMITRVPNDDPALAQRLIAAVPQGGFSDRMQSAAVNQMGMNDPAAAAAFLATLPLSGRLSSFYMGLGKNWAGSDPDAALEWARNLPNERFRNVATQGALRAWSDDEPAAAAAWASANLSDKDAANLLGEIGEQWSRINPKAALDWTVALPEGEARNAAIESVIGAVAALDAERAKAVFAKLPDDARSTAASAIASHWAERDVVAAADWAVALPEENVRRNALIGVIERWVTDDAPAAGAWLRALPPGTVRDDAAAEFIGDISSENLPQAGSLVALVSDPDQREEVAATLPEQWMKEDKAAAMTWLGTTPAFSPAARDRLLKRREASAPEKVLLLK